MGLPSSITITDAAAERVKKILADRGDPNIALKISIDEKGCSGLGYQIDFVTTTHPMDEVVEDKGVRILIDPKAVMFILGSEMDYIEAPLQSGFVFNNPNAKGVCGCGESFQV
tara:strand:- start:386 stop:724 length:339 start_codon:yes stop_codon:yes gene_type:complete